MVQDIAVSFQHGSIYFILCFCFTWYLNFVPIFMSLCIAEYFSGKEIFYCNGTVFILLNQLLVGRD